MISSVPIDVVNRFYVYCLSNIWRWTNVCIEYTLMVITSSPDHAACPVRVCCQLTILHLTLLSNCYKWDFSCLWMSGSSLKKGSSSSLLILCPQLVQCCHICQDFTTQLEKHCWRYGCIFPPCIPMTILPHFTHIYFGYAQLPFSFI